MALRNNVHVIIILHEFALVFVLNGKCNDNNDISNNDRQSVSWCGHESVKIMLLPIFLWKRDHNTRRTDAHGKSSLQELRPRTSGLGSSGSRRPANFFTLTTTTTTTPYQMSRGPPTTLPVGLARKRRGKRSYDKFGVPIRYV